MEWGWVLHSVNIGVGSVIIVAILFPKVGKMIFAHVLAASLEEHKTKMSKDLEAFKMERAKELEGYRAQLNWLAEEHRGYILRLGAKMQAVRELERESLFSLRTLLTEDRRQMNTESLMAHAEAFFHTATSLSGILPLLVTDEIQRAQRIYDQDGAHIRPEYPREINASLDAILKQVNLAITEVRT